MAANDGNDSTFDPFPIRSAAQTMAIAADGPIPTSIHNPSAPNQRTVFAKNSKATSMASNSINGALAPAGDKENCSGMDASAKALVASKDARIQGLEGELASKDRHIAQLSTQLDERDHRIEQLEQDLTVYRHRTADLERKLNAHKLTKSVHQHTRNATPTESSPESPAKDSSMGSSVVIVSGSVAESESNTDVSTVVLDEGLAEKFTDGPQDTIANETEKPTAPSVEHANPEVTIDNPADVVINEGPRTPKAQLPPKVLPSPKVQLPPKFQPSPKVQSTPKAQATHKPATAESTAVKEALPSPSIVAASPKHKQTKAKAAAAPVKPAPKLMIPIKNGGKIEPKVTTAAWADKAATHIGKGALTAGIPTKDLREMPLPERNELFRGPTVSILMGTEHVRGLPKNMLMAVSPPIRKYFEVHPTETFIAFPPRSLAVPCLEMLKVYFRNMGSHKNVYSLRLTHMIEQDLAIRRDCIFLGMDKYVAHFTRNYCDKIRGGWIGLDNIACIEKNTKDDDSMWECLANNLASMRVRGLIPEPEKFEEFLQAHPRLAQAIGRIEARIKMSRPSQRASDNTSSSRSPSKAPSASSGPTAPNSRRVEKPPHLQAAPKNAPNGRRPPPQDVKTKAAAPPTGHAQNTKPKGTSPPKDRKPIGDNPASTPPERKAKSPSETKTKPAARSTSPQDNGKPATSSTAPEPIKNTSTPTTPQERKPKPGDRIAEYERMCAASKAASKAASSGSVGKGNDKAKAG